MKNKVLLFLNGEPPKTFPNLSDYSLIACTDGAFHYLKRYGFPMDQLDFISGDFDSHSGSDDELYKEKFIHTPDQDKTDFCKSLEIIADKGFTNIHVLGASGGEQDHFLGNLSVAYSFKDRLQIRFFDAHSEYFFIPKNFVLNNVNQKMISLYPFPIAENVSTSGLNWSLKNESLGITTKIGTRNFAVADEVSIFYEKGDILVFVGAKYL
ncbi:thiamine diphosphokinase [Chryseobacterium sp.]|uniref:thiamine diphosphokinase n=1 Tax=Chryseobacterium sp. TaxID=1871047 RepID=UPI0038905388